MSFPRLRRERLSAVVQKAIKDYIIQSGLKAGDPIPAEMTLAEELGISRAAIRETLKSLEALELRQVLESTYVERSVDRYTEEDIREMHALLDRLSQSVNDKAEELELIRLHTDFHLLLYRHTHNQLLLDLIKIFATIQRAVWITHDHVTEDRAQFIRYHRRIVSAIELRDRTLARERMREHFSEISEWIAQLEQSSSVGISRSSKEVPE